MNLSDIHDICKKSVEKYFHHSFTSDKTVKFAETTAYGIGFEDGMIAALLYLKDKTPGEAYQEIQEYIKETTLNQEQYD